MRMATAVAILLVAAFLVGCDDGVQAGPSQSEYAEARSKQAELAKKGAAKEQKVAKKAPVAKDSSFGSVAASYVYDPEGKRDPFRSVLRDIAGRKPTDIPRAPLEQFEIQQLALSAIVWDANRPRALVSDPGGRSFVIMQGSRIGKNDGRVIHIGDNLVLVKETYVDFAGEQTTRDVEMRIRRRQGG